MIADQRERVNTGVAAAREKEASHREQVEAAKERARHRSRPSSTNASAAGGGLGPGFSDLGAGPGMWDGRGDEELSAAIQASLVDRGMPPRGK